MKIPRLLPAPLMAIAVVLGIWSLTTRVLSDPKPDNSNTPASVPNPTKAASSTRPADAALAIEIDRAIEQSGTAQARWGVVVVSLKDGRTVYTRDGDKLFTPASNMKIFTTAVALDVLGADYRWRTSVYAAREIDASGIIDGDLTLYGRGAPDFNSKGRSGLPALVDQLYQRGLRRVRGDIVGDESYFRAEMYGHGWQWNDLQWYYGAEPSALTIDENSVEVTIAPGARNGASASVLVNPNDDYVRLINNTMTGSRDALTSIGIQRGLSNNNVQVWGEFPVGGRSFSAFLSVHDPGLHAASIFKRLLIARGVQVEGDARSEDSRVAEKARFDPQKSAELGYVESAPLAKIVHQTNKESNNLYAELLLRTLGKERGATAPDPNPRKNATRGDDVAGTAVIGKWLIDHGIKVNGVAIHDGSGLSRLNLITPNSVVGLLTIAAQAPWAPTFHDSLPVAGRDGTLRGRLKNVSGRIVAKTGFLTYNQSLSGYATTRSGEVLVFSIIRNDGTNPARTIDMIGSHIAAYDPEGR